MSVFDDEVREGTQEILAEAGTSAVYHPATGSPVPEVWVVIDRDVIPTQPGQLSQTVERRTELTASHDVLGQARKGETVAVGQGTAAETWRLDRKDRDDGQLVTWWVTPVL